MTICNIPRTKESAALNYSWIKALEGVCKGFHIVEYFWGYKKNFKLEKQMGKKGLFGFHFTHKIGIYIHSAFLRPQKQGPRCRTQKYR